MKNNETNTLSTAIEAPTIEAEQEQALREPTLLHKMGKKVLETLYTGGALYAMAHTVDPSLPPQYSVPSAIIGGAIVNKGVDMIKARKKRTSEAQDDTTSSEIGVGSSEELTAPTSSDGEISTQAFD